MTLHALDKGFRITEIPIDYRDRPAGSESKLNTIKDGYFVLKTIFRVIKDYKPLTFFTIVSSLLFVLGLLAGIPVINEFIKTGYINKLPSAVLAVGLILSSGLLITCGLILDTIVRQHKENFEEKLLVMLCRHVSIVLPTMTMIEISILKKTLTLLLTSLLFPSRTETSETRE